MYSGVYPVFTDWLSPTAKKFELNVDKAKRLLGTLGYSTLNANGYLVSVIRQVLEFNLATNAGNAQREVMADIVAATAKQAGVKVNVLKIVFNTLVNQITFTGADRPFDVILLGLTGGNIVFRLESNVIPCTGNLHAHNRSDACLFAWEPQMQDLYAQSAAEPDRAKRIEIVWQIQDLEAEHQPFV